MVIVVVVVTSVDVVDTATVVATSCPVGVFTTEAGVFSFGKSVGISA